MISNSWPALISFDLDETLVHCSYGHFPELQPIPIQEDWEGKRNKCYIYERPGIRHLLDYCKEKSPLVIFTASVRNYAHTVLRETGLKCYFSKIYTREDMRKNAGSISDTTLKEWRISRDQSKWIKNLTLLGVPLSHVVAIDNDASFYVPPHRQRLIEITTYDLYHPSFGKNDAARDLRTMPLSISQLCSVP